MYDVDDGNFSDALEPVPDGSSVLIAADATPSKTSVLRGMLAAGRGGVVYVATDRARDSLPVTVPTEDLQLETVPPDAASDFVELSFELGSRITALKEADVEEVRVVVDSVSSWLLTHEDAAVLEYLQLLLARITQEGYLGVCTLDFSVAEELTGKQIKYLFDYRCHVDGGGRRGYEVHWSGDRTDRLIRYEA